MSKVGKVEDLNIQNILQFINQIKEVKTNAPIFHKKWINLRLRKDETEKEDIMPFLNSKMKSLNGQNYFVVPNIIKKISKTTLSKNYEKIENKISYPPTNKKALELYEESLDKTIFDQFDWSFLNNVVGFFKNHNIFTSWDAESVIKGKPFAVKSNFLRKGKLTTACSSLLQSFIAPYESTVTDRLMKAGFIPIGNTNMDEFAMGSTGEYSCYEPTSQIFSSSDKYLDSRKNNFFCPGGSSSGSAVAVQAGLSLFSIGSDTAGSVRLPASLCGIVGFKGTFGRISRYGLIDLSSAFDHVGFFTRTVKEAAYIFNLLKHQDENDYTTTDSIKTKEIKKKFAVVDIEMDEKTKLYLEKTSDFLIQQGYERKNIHLSFLKYSIPIYCIISRAEAASNLSRYNSFLYGAQKDLTSDPYEIRELFGEEVKRRIVIGNYVLHSSNIDGYYLHAQRVLQELWMTIEKEFEEVDFFLMPTAPKPWLMNHKLNPIEIYLCDIYLAFANMLGLPALSIPVGEYDDGASLGLQLVGAPMTDEEILNVGELIDNHFQGWNRLKLKIKEKIKDLY